LLLGWIIYKNLTEINYINIGNANCAAAGEVSSISSLGPEAPPEIECCSGLVVIDDGFVYQPNEESADENGCAIRWGAPAICSDCGNDNCEDWENRCNCPEDC
jgi:hypothetical protein